MKICINCFVDAEIKSIIKTIEFEDDCDICNSTSVYVYNTENHTELEHTFNRLLERYTIKSKLSEDYPSNLTVSIKSELKNNWKIFNDLEESKIHDILITICSVKYEEVPEFFNDLVGVSELGSTKYLKENTLFYSQTWEDFSNELKYKTRFHSRKFNTYIFKKYLSFLTEPINKDTLLYRGRLSNGKAGYHEISDMGRVPPENTQPGRANPKGIPYLYLARELKTVLSELRVTKAGYITIAEFSLKETGKVIDLTKIDEISPFIFEDEEMLTLHMVNRKHLERIHNEIVKPVSQYDTYLDYLPTQYIFDFIRNNKTTMIGDSAFENRGYQEIIGIKYKSSLQSDGLNYVFFHDDIFDIRNPVLYKVENIEYQKVKVT